jgi:putative beta barrel porin BBP7
MRNGFLTTLGCLLASSGAALAQGYYPTGYGYGYGYPAAVMNYGVQPVAAYGYGPAPMGGPGYAMPQMPAYAPGMMMPPMAMPSLPQPFPTGMEAGQPATGSMPAAAPNPEVGPAAAADTPASGAHLGGSCDKCGPHCWAGAEYMMWWVKNGPEPLPLVTQGPQAGPGTIGAPGVSLLFGGKDFDYQTYSGMQVTAGAWVNPEETFGVEGSLFMLPRQSVGFNAALNGSAPVSLFIPFIQTSGAPGAILVAGQNGLGSPRPGGILIASSSWLWGGDAHGVVNLVRNDRYHANALVGIQYLDLNENLSITGLEGNISGVGGTTGVIGFADRFATTNKFVGGQFGLEGGMQWGRLAIDLRGTVAVGTMREQLDILGLNSATGNALVTTPNALPLAPGGIFAQTSNIGRQINDAFAAVPSVELKLGYDLTSWLRATVAYEFLYITQVVRPGNQIDPVLHPAFAPPDTIGDEVNTFGGTRPSPLFNRSDYWAHGVNFGFDFRF